MSQPLIVRSSISIDAPAAKVWDALVNPEQTKKYMFGCEALRLAARQSLIWKGNFNGMELVAVKGHIVDIQPGHYLAYTTIDPNSTTVPDLPENYVTVTYTSPKPPGDATRLDITQGDFAHVANGQQRYTETYNNGEGWNPILVQIKALAETAGS